MKNFIKDQELIPNDVPGFDERKSWLKDLWSIDESQAQFQILALLIQKRT